MRANKTYRSNCTSTQPANREKNPADRPVNRFFRPAAWLFVLVALFAVHRFIGPSTSPTVLSSTAWTAQAAQGDGSAMFRADWVDEVIDVIDDVIDILDGEDPSDEDEDNDDESDPDDGDDPETDDHSDDEDAGDDDQDAGDLN